jgi:spore coat protein U-like protein
LKAKLKILVAATCMIGAGMAHAQVANPVSGTVNAQLVLTSGCAINSGSGSTGTLANFGTLNFGTQPSGFTGSLTASASGTGSTGTTQVTCSPDVTAVKVSVDGGLYAGKGAANGTGSRAMSDGTDYVPYEVYSDSADTVQYVAGTTQSVTVPTPGSPFNLPIYGVANKTNPVALSSGTYLDTLNVTLGW